MDDVAPLICNYCGLESKNSGQSLILCPICKTVGYCSTDHMLADCSTHCGYCIRISQTDSSDSSARSAVSASTSSASSRSGPSSASQLVGSDLNSVLQGQMVVEHAAAAASNDITSQQNTTAMVRAMHNAAMQQQLQCVLDEASSTSSRDAAHEAAALAALSSLPSTSLLEQLMPSTSTASQSSVTIPGSSNSDLPNFSFPFGFPNLNGLVGQVGISDLSLFPSLPSSEERQLHPDLFLQGLRSNILSSSVSALPPSVIAHALASSSDPSVIAAALASSASVSSLGLDQLTSVAPSPSVLSSTFSDTGTSSTITSPFSVPCTLPTVTASAASLLAAVSTTTPECSKPSIAPAARDIEGIRNRILGVAPPAHSAGLPVIMGSENPPVAIANAIGAAPAARASTAVAPPASPERAVNSRKRATPERPGVERIRAHPPNCASQAPVQPLHTIQPINVKQEEDEDDCQIVHSNVRIYRDHRLNTVYSKTLREHKEDLLARGLHVSVHQAMVLRLRYMADHVLRMLNEFGWAVVDNFLGSDHTKFLVSEMRQLYANGIFRAGQVMDSSKQPAVSEIRSDYTYWYDGVDERAANAVTIRLLISMLDSLILHFENRIEGHTIGGRSRAMLAIYPGRSSRYVKHVDNPARDGRLITCIYYCNEDWNLQRDGGALRLYPHTSRNPMDVDPQADRVIFFWSDRRNPHEVMPVKRPRFAVTIWYMDKEERMAALAREKKQAEADSDIAMDTNSVETRIKAMEEDATDEKDSIGPIAAGVQPSTISPQTSLTTGDSGLGATSSRSIGVTQPRMRNPHVVVVDSDNEELEDDDESELPRADDDFDYMI